MKIKFFTLAVFFLLTKSKLELAEFSFIEVGHACSSLEKF